MSIKSCARVKQCTRSPDVEVERAIPLVTLTCCSFDGRAVLVWQTAAAVRVFCLSFSILLLFIELADSQAGHHTSMMHRARSLSLQPFQQPSLLQDSRRVPRFVESDLASPSSVVQSFPSVQRPRKAKEAFVSSAANFSNTRRARARCTSDSPPDKMPAIEAHYAIWRQRFACSPAKVAPRVPFLLNRGWELGKRRTKRPHAAGPKTLGGVCRLQRHPAPHGAGCSQIPALPRTTAILLCSRDAHRIRHWLAARRLIPALRPYA